MTKTGMTGHVWNNGQHSQLRLEVSDLQEFIMRCGWTSVESIEGLTPEAEREIARLEALSEIVSDGSGLGWWQARLVTSEPALTPDN